VNNLIDNLAQIPIISRGYCRIEFSVEMIGKQVDSPLMAPSNCLEGAAEFTMSRLQTTRYSVNSWRTNNSTHQMTYSPPHYKPK